MVSEQVSKCIDILKDRNLTIAFAEGASAGNVHYHFASFPESEKIILGKIVALKNHMKEYFFGIKPDFLQKFGNESPEVAKEMAQSLCEYFEADICIAVTGNFDIKTFDLKRADKQSVFIHLIFPNKVISKTLKFNGSAWQMAEETIESIAAIIFRVLNSKSKPFTLTV